MEYVGLIVGLHVKVLVVGPMLGVDDGLIIGERVGMAEVGFVVG